MILIDLNEGFTYGTAIARDIKEHGLWKASIMHEE